MALTIRKASRHGLQPARSVAVAAWGGGGGPIPPGKNVGWPGGGKDPSVRTFLRMSQSPHLILASASPRRRALLAGLGVAFVVIPAEVTEHEAANSDPRLMVRHNAALKADWVSTRHPQDFVLGADTTVCIDGIVLNKPRDLLEARGMLRRLSGRTHTVCTGLAVRRAEDGLAVDRVVESEVTFKPFDDIGIDRYLARVDPLDKAGAYAIQEGADLIIAGWRGSYTNIVGLPLEETKQILTGCGLVKDLRETL